MKRSFPTTLIIAVLVFALNGCHPANPYPLSETGPYGVGVIKMVKLEDLRRENRQVTLTVWYPAEPIEGSESAIPVKDAVPNRENAPHPLILSSTKVGTIFASHLASYGFVVIGINSQDSTDHWGQWQIDYPLDILLALEQVASKPIEGLDGMIDTDHAGVMGYSFDGYTSLSLSGARVDPEYFLDQCATATIQQPKPPGWWVDYICNMNGGWEGFLQYANELGITGDEELWLPMTDNRIRAVMPMAPEGAWLFGENGLAAIDRPLLIIGATNDVINVYNLEAVYIFEHAGVHKKTLISFIGQEHGMVGDPEQVARMEHFATAFFGYYLQGKEGYADLFSMEFIEKFDDLAWGVYPGE